MAEFEDAGTHESGSLPPYRLLVTGWRFWPRSASARIHQILQQVRDHLPIEQRLIITEGACPYDGVDQYAYEWAVNHAVDNVVPDRVRAEWTKYDRAAGPIRNQAMVDKGPDYFVAFPQFRSREEAAAHRAKQSGTHDCVDRAIAANVPGFIVPWVGEPRNVLTVQPSIFSFGMYPDIRFGTGN